MLRVILRLLKTIWQLPQVILGLLLEFYYKPVEWTEYNGVSVGWYEGDKALSGIGLGERIYLRKSRVEELPHEYGHCVQSLILGPLYLPVVGIYSAVFCNLWDRLFHKDWCYYDCHYWYYKLRWTERGADKKGKVDRDKILSRIHRPDNARYPAVKAA